MASLHRSSATLKHLRGKVGDLIIKHYGNRVVVTRIPRLSKKKPTTRAKAGWRDFAAGSRYAQRVKKDDPETFAVYEAEARKRRIPTRAVAISDFKTRPKFSDVHTIHRDGVLAAWVAMADRFLCKTTAVSVVVRDHEGRELARGPAAPEGKKNWRLSASCELDPETPLSIDVTASDRLNRTSREGFRGPVNRTIQPKAKPR